MLYQTYRTISCHVRSEINQILDKQVQEWTENYNATHGKRISDILQIGVMPSVT